MSITSYCTRQISDLVNFVPGLLLLWGVANRVFFCWYRLSDTIKLKTVCSAIYVLLTSNFENVGITEVRNSADDKVCHSNQE